MMPELTNIEKPRITVDSDGRPRFLHYCEDFTSSELLPLWEFGWSYDAAEDTISAGAPGGARSIHCARCGTHGFWTNGEWA